MPQPKGWGIFVASLTDYILQYAFQSFCVIAEVPGLPLKMTVISGMYNLVLDALLVAVFKWGLVGTAVATATAQVKSLWCASCGPTRASCALVAVSLTVCCFRFKN